MIHFNDSHLDTIPDIYEGAFIKVLSMRERIVASRY